MARIKGKLNLNRVPELAENNSLIFAKNVRWFANSFRADYGFSDLGLEVGDSKIVGIIQHNTKFYVFLFNQTTKESAIKVYDEIEKTFTPVECNWHYGGVEVGETAITGYCTTDLYGETILTIGEYPVGASNLQIPLKHIVIGEKDNNGNMISSYEDDESIYTQAPNVPLLNLNLAKTYYNPIPAGTYQFFVRYEIRKDHYTNWFPASKELFAGTSRTMLTNQGRVKYIDKDVDSGESFIFDVEHVKDVNGFKSFQLGFIIAHDNEVYARAYKHYEITTEEIYFDYDTDYIEEIEVRDLLSSVYNLYNVKNITSYKNKLYIANYIESDFNPSISDYADRISIELKTVENTGSSVFFNKYLYTTATGGPGNLTYIDALTVDGENKTIPTICAELLELAKNWIKFKGSGNTVYHRCGIACNLTKYTTQDDNLDLGGETITRGGNDSSQNIDPDGTGGGNGSNNNSSTPSDIDPTENLVTWDGDKNYYLSGNGTSVTGTDENLQNILDIISGDVLGITINDGIVRSTSFALNTEYVITYYSPSSHIHGQQYKLTTQVTIKFTTKKSYINSSYQLNSTYSLVPYQKYNFYLHFVRSNGEITNGCKIPDAIINSDGTRTPNITGLVQYDEDGDWLVKESINDLGANAIYPAFTFDFALPSQYVACFISIAHVKNNVMELFNLTQMWSEYDNETGDDNKHLTADCLELDTALYPALTNIPVILKRGTVTTVDNEAVVTFAETPTEVDYRASYDSDFLATFGASGKCVFKSQTEEETDEFGHTTTTVVPFTLSNINYAFAKLKYEANEKYIQPVKCTPFISWEGSPSTYDKPNNLNLLGYVCRVCKLNPNYDKYFSGANIYGVNRSYDDESLNYKLSLEALADGADAWHTYQESPYFTIYSNFNLNYLSLRETIVRNLVTKDKEVSEEGIGNDQGKTFVSTVNYKTFLLLSFQSLNLSDVYELQAMYRQYTRKLYLPYTDDKNVLVFDNTIRSSELQGDEEHINMFKFRPTDYYHVPTNRGKIVNLVAVADNILVHTEDSMYRFTGTNSLMAAGGEDVAMTESQPFDTGIQEIFGSEYGYGGLQNKEHQALTEMGYVYFDRDARRLYLYGDQNRMEVLSNDIENLFKRKPISSIRIADDYYNNRVFVCITFNDSKIATLSYDFAAKSFISLHDFAFEWSFKTKTNCYFVHNKSKIFVVDNVIGEYEDLTIEDTLYPYNKRIVTTNNVTTNHYDCIVDVIFNDNFEIIKTLNTIQWVCNKINEAVNPTSDDIRSMLVAEETYDIANPEIRYKGDKLRIYTDSCATDLIDISDRSNDTRLTDINDYISIDSTSELPDEEANVAGVYLCDGITYTWVGSEDTPQSVLDLYKAVPLRLKLKAATDSYTQVRYNLGKWTYNYFRNILHRSNDQIGTRPFRQDDTLIYGKYIVARFIFTRTTNFKFEDVTFNITTEYNA